MKTISHIRQTYIDYFTKNNHKYVESSPLTPKGDDSLLFTNAGMVQFKNVFMGLETKDYLNAITVQKCLRAGGKHNDLENVGHTARHHTFFEMLGNFSFGGYFKEESILYAWEFLIKEIALNKDKLLVTVYDEDIETEQLWKKISGLDSSKIIKIATEDNFWSMGQMGPCGPCTEIFYDHGDHIIGGLPGSVQEGGDRYVEIWNIVFMQYQQLASGDMIKLSKPCVDTGMGLERIASVLQNVHDNYETDIFKALFRAIEDTVGISQNNSNIASFKVIADHLRSASFLIAEGITPSNEGRGYVLRRIIRRAVRYTHMLHKEEPIIYKLVPALKNVMASSYKELAIREAFIVDTIKQEELKFHETFEHGIKMLNDEIDKLGEQDIFSGKVAFKLYDTYGFPVDLTADILRKHNLRLDKQGFEEASKHHRELAQKSWKGSGENKIDDIWFKLSEVIPSTHFVGYESLVDTAVVKSLLTLDDNDKLIEIESLLEGQEGYLISDRSPFYAELGGQVGDRGYITSIKGDKHSFLIKVIDTQLRASGLFVHKILIVEGDITKNQDILMEVDALLRQQTSVHHTAAHLLHSALSKYVGSHIMQQGSMVNEHRMRFDISHPVPLSLQEISLVEELVNKDILQNFPIKIENMELDIAIKKGAKALFNEKYPKISRTVRIEGEDGESYSSFELCGGTHVKSTGEMGVFKIISEGSIASGVRRIEAVCGFKALEYFNTLEQEIKEIANIIGVDTKNLISKISKLNLDNKEIRKQLSTLSVKYYLELLADKKHVIANDMNYIIAELPSDANMYIKNVINVLVATESNLFVFLYTQIGEKLSYTMSISKNLANNLNLKILNQSILSIIQGTGGGSSLLIQGQGNSQKMTYKLNQYILEILEANLI